MAHHPWIFTFGILGNIISVMMYLSPVPTFLRVYRNKTTEGFQSIPYVVAMFATMLWIYYAILKSNDYLLLSNNCVGCLVESVYVAVFIVYAPKKARVLTLKLVLLSVLGFSSIFALTHFFARGLNRLHIVGWFSMALSAAVFAAPLSILKLVIRTKSVEFMPFVLSFFLTLSAILWFSYGVLLKDLYIALPNGLGIVLGTVQMICYAIYRNRKETEDHKVPEPEQLQSSIVSPAPVKTTTLVKHNHEDGVEMPTKVQPAECAA